MGLCAGRDSSIDRREASEGSLSGPIHVFFEHAGITASDSPTGQLKRVERPGLRIFHLLPDCQGPAFFGLVRVVLASPLGPEVRGTGTEPQVIRRESAFNVRVGGPRRSVETVS